MRFVNGYGRSLQLEIDETRKCTLWVRNGYFFDIKAAGIHYNQSDASQGSAMCVTDCAGYVHASDTRLQEASVSVRIHTALCRYQFYGIVGRWIGAKACMKTLQMNSSNENVLHVSLWKRNCSLWSGQTKREMAVCEDLWL